MKEFLDEPKKLLLTVCLKKMKEFWFDKTKQNPLANITLFIPLKIKLIA